MKIIVTSEQIEFKNFYYSIIFPKDSSLEVNLWISTIGSGWFKSSDILNPDSIKVIKRSDIYSDVESNKQIIKFHRGFLSKIYYYLQFDSVYYLLLKYGRNPGSNDHGVPRGINWRTVQYGFYKNLDFFTNLNINGYSFEKELLMLKKVDKDSIAYEEKFFKYFNIKNVLKYALIFTVLWLSVVIFVYFLSK